MTKLTKETAELMLKSTDKAIRQFALDNFPELEKKPLPKTWEELKIITGYYLSNSVDEYEDLYVGDIMNGRANVGNANVRKTEEQAKASIAMAQLSQLMYIYNEGWEPNWEDSSKKHVIYFASETIRTNETRYVRYFVAFKTEEIRDEFLKNFRDLIEIAKPLL